MNDTHRILSARRATHSLWELDSTIEVEHLHDLIDRAASLPTCMTLFIDVFKTSKVWPIDAIVDCIDKLADKRCSRITLRSAYEKRLTDLLEHPSLTTNSLVHVVGFTLGGHFVELDLKPSGS